MYRLLAAGTMEEKIYHRQVNKNALASRVLDKEQKNRHFKAQELENLYNFDPDGIEEVESGDEESGAGVVEVKAEDHPGGVSSNGGMARDRIPRFRNCTDAMPSDPVLVRLLGKMQPKWLLGYVDHDVLASGEGETELSTEEEAAAWAEYKAASKAQEEADAILKAHPFGTSRDERPHPPNYPLDIQHPGGIKAWAEYEAASVLAASYSDAIKPNSIPHQQQHIQHPGGVNVYGSTCISREERPHSSNYSNSLLHQEQPPQNLQDID